MTEIRKRIAALSVAASLLIGANGCSKNNIKRNIDENNNISYTGEVNLKGLNDLYIVEIVNVNKERKLYLTKRSIDNFFDDFDYEYLLFGMKDELTDSYHDYTSNYGTVENIIPFNQFLSIYASKITNTGEFKEKYTAEEILDIFDYIKKDYEEIMKNDNVKKLNLKK